MDTNIIMCGTRDDPFARVSKALLDDERLSWRAKGIMAYLLGKPKNWKLRVGDLIKRGDDGERSIRAALNELRDAGYAEFVRIRVDGTFREGVWKISDNPMFSPRCGFAHVVNAHVQNEDHSKKESTKTEFNKNETLSKEDTSCGGVIAFEEKEKIPAVWKPSNLSKEEQLDYLPVPDFPSEDEFDDFLADADIADVITNYRSDLYLDLCERKWHHWKPNLQKWVRIRDWQKYVVALTDKIMVGERF